MSRLCAVGAMLVLAGSAWSAEPLGRLFFTPAERAELDAARHRKAPPPPPPPAAVPAPPPPAAAQIEEPPREAQVLTYRGIVKRSDGKSTVWLNNRPMDAKEALAGLPVTGQVRPDGAMSLVDPQTGRRIDLKVGQSVELEAGGATEGRRTQRATAPRAGVAGGGAAGSRAAALARPPNDGAER